MPANPLPLLPLILDDVPGGLRQALEQEGIPFCDRAAGPPRGRFVLFDSRRRTPGQVTASQMHLDVNPLREGFDSDPFADLLDERAGRFRWQIGPMCLTEQVARVEKRTLRRKVLRQLRRRIEQAGGIWLRVGAFPFPYRSAFNFRIDYDQYDPHDFHATLGAIAGYEPATSHYLSGAAYAQAGEALARLRGLDVGSHGYWHHTYRTADENERNVARGIETLRAARIEPSGFVAPHGRFNRGLLRALERLGVGHSSEFSLSFDELPFTVGNGGLLQLPIHPVSLGIFLEAAPCDPGGDPEGARAAAADRAADYFAGLIEARCRAGEPAFLYGHPTARLGRYPHVLHRALAAAGRLDHLWKTTLSQFAAWWGFRSRVQLSVTERGGRFAVWADGHRGGYPPAVEYLRGQQVASIPLENRTLEFSPEAVPWQDGPPADAAGPMRIGVPQGIRNRLRQWIDWERVTPVDQIGTGDWRNRTKRTLRRLLKTQEP